MATNRSKTSANFELQDKLIEEFKDELQKVQQIGIPAVQKIICQLLREEKVQGISDAIALAFDFGVVAILKELSDQGLLIRRNPSENIYTKGLFVYEVSDKEH